MSIVVRDALLHFVHFLFIFALVAMLVSEAILLKKALPQQAVAQLQGVDRWYGITAGLVILSGLALVFFDEKGAAYYAHNPIFWTKMGLFLAIALLSIVPTIAFLRWNDRLSSDGSLVLEDAEYHRLRAVLWIQLGLLVLLPLCAALMANGIV